MSQTPIVPFECVTSPFFRECEEISGGASLNGAITDRNPVSPDTGTSFEMEMTFKPAVLGRNVEHPVYPPRPELAEVSRNLRRLAGKIGDALEEDAEDVLARDAAIRKALPFLGLAFQYRHGLKEPVRDLLSHILTCLSSPMAARNDTALRFLHGVIDAFSRHTAGTTEKDVNLYIARLEEAGFNLVAPLCDLPSGEELENA